MIRKVLVIGILGIAILANACSDDELSKEDEIKQYIESGVEAAEDRSANDLSELVDEGYLDEKSLDKTQLTKLLRLYFFRHKNIYLFTKIDEIDFLAENEALVTLHVAMAGSVISDVNALTSLRAKIYQFELYLVKQEEWLLQQAKWQAASTGDLQ